MIVKNVIVSIDLHARPATYFVNECLKYKSKIWIEYNDKKCDAKSILGVISLELLPGKIILICADGEDEQQALEAVLKYLIKKF